MDVEREGRTRAEIIWARRNPWTRPALPPLNLASKVWAHFDDQARGPFERLDFLSLQAEHPSRGIRTGFIRVLKGNEPVVLLPFFVAHVTMDDTPCSPTTKTWLRRLKLPQLARWMNLPISLIGIEALFLGGYHSVHSQFFTRSGTLEEVNDRGVERAILSAIRKLQWQTGSVQFDFYNFKNDPETLRLFERWGLDLQESFPSTVLDLDAWRLDAGHGAQPRDYLNSLDRKRRAYLRKEVIPPLENGQATLEEPSREVVRSLAPAMYRAYQSQRAGRAIPWLAVSQPMLEQLVDLPTARTRILWVRGASGEKQFAAFNLVMTHAGSRTNYWYGVDPGYRTEEESRAKVSPWYSVVYSDIASAIREGVHRLELGQSAYFNKLHMGARLMRLVHAGKSLLRGSRRGEEPSAMSREYLYGF